MSASLLDSGQNSKRARLEAERPSSLPALNLTSRTEAHGACTTAAYTSIENGGTNRSGPPPEMGVGGPQTLRTTAPPPSSSGATPPQEGAAPDPKGPVPQTQKVGAYTARELHLQSLEADGEVSFQYVKNDGDPLALEWMMGLKNIFSKQLPNMPKEYICRLVLDRRHRSMVILQRDKRTVIGGITYRAFPPQRLGEIAFCAIAAPQQVKGYGTRLMNYTKEAARTHDALTHFLTYADNNAVGYFTKQGFTKQITLDTTRWQGYIKDYDGGTLMECVLHPKLCYTDFPAMIGAQRAALNARVQALSRSHLVYPPLSFGVGTERRAVPLGDIPGVREGGWSPMTHSPLPRPFIAFQLVIPPGLEAVPGTTEAMQRFLNAVLTDLHAQDAFIWPFREPVTPEEVPDYRDVIKAPIDLRTMRERLDSRQYYNTLEIFFADLRRMCDNARLYNTPETIYYKLANQCENYINTTWVPRILYTEEPTAYRP